MCFSLTVIKRDDEGDRQRDEGKEEDSYEDNRATLYSLTKSAGDTRSNMDIGLFWGPWEAQVMLVL